MVLRKFCIQLRFRRRVLGNSSLTELLGLCRIEIETSHERHPSSRACCHSIKVAVFQRNGSYPTTHSCKTSALPKATFTAPALTTFTKLDGLGLIATVQHLILARVEILCVVSTQGPAVVKKYLEISSPGDWPTTPLDRVPPSVASTTGVSPVGVCGARRRLRSGGGGLAQRDREVITLGRIVAKASLG